MPRPRVLKRARVVPLVFEDDLYERLREVAKRRGLSVSAFIRQLVVRELQQAPLQTHLQIPSDPLSPTDPDPPVDPLVQVQFEEFEEELASLEERLSKLEVAVKRLPAGGFRAGAPLGEQAARLRTWLWDLNKAWEWLHREYKELAARVEPERARKWNLKLAELRRRWLALKRFLYAK